MAATPSTRAIAKVFFTLAGLSLLLYVAYLVRSVLILVFIAVFLALALAPPVDFLNRHHVPRALAIVLVYLATAAGIVGVGLIVVPPIVEQVDDFSRDVPGYIQDLRDNETFRDYDERYGILDKLEEQAERLPARLGDAASTLQNVTVGVFSAAIQLVAVLTIVFFLLLDGRRLVDFVLGLFGPVRGPRLRTVADDIYGAVSGYVLGNVIISVVAGSVTYVTLRALGVPFAAPLAVLMAFLDLIPLVGATIGGLVIGLITVFNDFPTATIVWAVVLIVYQQIENNLMQPLIYHRTVDVPPLAVIVAILIGAALLGVLGALLAIPVAAAVQIALRDWWRARRGPEVPLGEDEEGEGGPDPPAGGGPEPAPI